MTQTVLLGDLINIRSGKSRPKDGGNFPVYGGNGIFDSAPTSNMNGPAVIVGRVGAYCGSVYIERKPFWLSDNALGITAKEGSDLQFLYYLLKSIDLNNKSVGGAQPLLTQGILNGISVTVPSFDAQKEIADILGTIDEKIEVNRKMNETLEQMGQALFRHYFIDNPEVDKWERAQLGRYLKVERGLSYKGAFLSDDDRDNPMINLGSFAIDGTYNEENLKYYSGEYKTRTTVKPGDLVLANTDMTQDRVVLGSVLSVPNLSETILFTHHVYGLRELKLPKEFLFYLLKRPQFRERAQGFATGTTVLFMPTEAITKLEFRVPDEKTMGDFVKITADFFDRRELIRKEIQTLTTLRDTLLPRLINGKLEV